MVIEAEHLCMAMRGDPQAGARTTTSAVRGMFQTSRASRAEAMALDPAVTGPATAGVDLPGPGAAW